MASHVPSQLPTTTCKIIIVGGGCYGLSTAYALSLKKEYEVWVFDRLPIPVNDAASTDINKAVRMDYADKTLYMQLMISCLPLWRQWNEERASMGLDPVYHETGLLSFARDGKFSEYERQCLSHLREAGFGHAVEELTGEMIVQKFPQFQQAVANGYNIAYFNKEGGWCHSSEAIKHLHEKCKRNGVRFVVGEEGCFERFLFKDDDTVSGIVTKNGKSHDADRVVLATGSWTAGLIDTSDQLVASGQVVIQFNPPGEMAEELKNLPVWCADVSKTGKCKMGMLQLKCLTKKKLSRALGYYGFPVHPSGIMKVARHSTGYLNPRQQDQVSVPRTQVSHAADTIPVGAVRSFRKFLKSFLPQTEALDLSYTRLCWYSDTTSGDFLITPHPKYKSLVVASGDSGHAMKFLPILGFKIREIIEGVTSDYSRTWAWRATSSHEHAQRLVLNDVTDAETQLATPEALQAGACL
ncbi:hypothetical protein DFQ30_006538 [Apophysomyces sp. BC1015]|nr:hypothetical protein DFQ30_006538 [Apophysomyces sp. BC1015]KAG0176516.1 hypothetical protein DFQ29_006006 [Apophysomyces sp. BC1021]